jgi:predicted peptidase
LIEALCNEYPIDKGRIYLTGLSSGRLRHLGSDLAKAGTLRGGIPVCGGGDPAQAEKLARLSIWAFQGDADPLVPVEQPRDTSAAIKKAGGKPKVHGVQGGRPRRVDADIQR